MPADADVVIMRQAFPAAEDAAQDKYDAKRARRHEEIEDGFGKLGEFEFGVGKRLIATAEDGRGETKERRAKYGGEHRGGAKRGELAKFAAEEFEAIANPGAQACDHAGESRFRSNAAAKKEWQKRTTRCRADVFVFVSAGFLDVGHHRLEALGIRTKFALKKPHENATERANHERPPPRVDVRKRGVGDGVPNEVDAVVEQEEKKPHRRSGKSANDDREERKNYAVDDGVALDARITVVARRGLRRGRRLRGVWLGWGAHCCFLAARLFLDQAISLTRASSWFSGLNNPIANKRINMAHYPTARKS